MAMRVRLSELIREKQHHENRDLSIAAVARETNISRPTLTNWNNGKSKCMDTRIMGVLQDYFGCDWNALFERIPDPDKQSE